MEWYVLREVNGEIKPWNIFDNYYVKETAKKLKKKYQTGQITYDQFEDFLRRAIMYEEWCRCEYEILVGSLFEHDIDKFKKIDCYSQVVPNIKILAKYVLED